MAIRCMNAITASKLYRASTRKAKILAAINDPINVELVEQLNEYIGDEYKELLNPDTSTEDAVEVDDTAEVVDGEPTEDDSTPDIPAMGRGGSPIRPKLSEQYGEDLDREVAEKADATSGDEDWEDDSTSGTADSANSSTQMSDKRKIQADTTTVTPTIGVYPSMNQLAGEIKGTLNARAATAGVVRTNFKGDEFWIYYNDETNLNNVMTPVIDLLNSASYNYLIFNRLARTDNAIVFTFALNDTDAVMKPASDGE